MAQEITIPRLGWSMEEGVFVEWLKAPGELVRAGDMVFLLEGDKAVHEIESFDSGYLHVPENAPGPGDTVRVGQVIGFLLAQDESPPTFVKESPADSTSSSDTSSSDTSSSDTWSSDAPRATAPLPVTLDASDLSPATPRRPAGPAARRRARELGIDLNTVGSPDPTGRVARADVERAAEESQRFLSSAISSPIATPRARRRAKELGVDWTRLHGTGRNGRIRERDVLAQRGASSGALADSSQPAPVTGGTHTPASKLRRVLAQRMHAGVTKAAPVTLTTKVDAAPLVACRAHHKRLARQGEAPSFNDIVVALAARTLGDLPELNACWYRDGIYAYEAVHVAIAVDTPAGLVAPVIRHADQLRLAQIAERSRQLIAQARGGQLSPSDLEGGTFTVSNLGMFGIDTFTPILNLPQAAILGVGRIVEEPVVRAGRLEIGHTLSLSLTFDHRVVDGAPAARWLQRFCQLLSQLADESSI